MYQFTVFCIILGDKTILFVVLYLFVGYYTEGCYMERAITSRNKGTTPSSEHLARFVALRIGKHDLECEK